MLRSSGFGGNDNRDRQTDYFTPAHAHRVKMGQAGFELGCSAWKILS